MLYCADTAAAGVAICFPSAAPVAFGTYDPTTSMPNDSTGEIKVVCLYASGGASKIDYSVALSRGGSGSYAPRELTSVASQRLQYNLFADPARSAVWGDGTSNTTVVSGELKVGPGRPIVIDQNVHPIYGRIPARQDAQNGTYSDTIVVTLEF